MGSGPFVTAYQRIASSIGSLLPSQRGIKFGSGFSVTDVPAGVLGAAGEITGYTNVESVAPGTGGNLQVLWTSGVKGALAADFAGGYMGLMYANRSGSTADISSVYINGGIVGITADAVNTSKARLLALSLDAPGDAVELAVYTNQLVAVSALTDLQLDIESAGLLNGFGVWLELSVTDGVGKDLGPGFSVRFNV